MSSRPDDKTRGLPWVWGATPAEAAAQYPCDEFAAEGSVRAIRAVTAHASAAECFRWLCQLRRAPYSYDLIDNFGRRSPRVSDHTLTHLRPGLDFMTIFTLVAYTPDRSITLRIKPGRAVTLFGDVTVTYHLADGLGHTRMIAVLALPPANSLTARLRQSMLVWGDLLMMRKQLIVLSGLAERDARHSPPERDARHSPPERDARHSPPEAGTVRSPAKPNAPRPPVELAARHRRTGN